MKKQSNPPPPAIAKKPKAPPSPPIGTMEFKCTRSKLCEYTDCSHRKPHEWNGVRTTCEIACLNQARGVCGPIKKRGKRVNSK